MEVITFLSEFIPKALGLTLAFILCAIYVFIWLMIFVGVILPCMCLPAVLTELLYERIQYYKRKSKLIDEKYQPLSDDEIDDIV